ncbi:MAG TPA: type IV pilus assembly protein PilM [Blastocatellia bacterium]|nr:type IV pilus assembly protein PilM [Blastocatellia bacterium]
MLSEKFAGITKFGKGKKGLIGLDIGSSRVKVIELKASGKGSYELISIGQVGLMADTIVDGQIIDGNHVSDCINRIFDDQGIKNDQIATSISGHAVIIKKISVPVMSNEELREQIQWEAEQHIPFDINDVNLDYHVIEGREGDNMEVLLVACKKDVVSQLTQVVSQAGKSPTVVDVDAFAMQNAYEVSYRPQPNEIVMLLNIGASFMSINIVRGTNSVFTRDISMGGNQYTDILQRELSLAFEQAEILKRGGEVEGSTVTFADAVPFLDSVTEMLVSEVQRTLDFFYNQASPDTEELSRILVGGGCSKIHGLIQCLSERFRSPVETFNPFRSINVSPKKFDENYIQEFAPDMAVAVGLALRNVD